VDAVWNVAQVGVQGQFGRIRAMTDEAVTSPVCVYPAGIWAVETARCGRDRCLADLARLRLIMPDFVNSGQSRNEATLTPKGLSPAALQCEDLVGAVAAGGCISWAPS
jgi:hypothetical protein